MDIVISAFYTALLASKFLVSVNASQEALIKSTLHVTGGFLNVFSGDGFQQMFSGLNRRYRTSEEDF
jgi:hypothetical protein